MELQVEESTVVLALMVHVQDVAITKRSGTSALMEVQELSSM
jgi:hypothetical protein